MNDLSPIVSEFETEQQAAAYAAWLKRKVEHSLADPRASVSHDEAMARVDAIIAAKDDQAPAC